MTDAFDLYLSAKTQADLYHRQNGTHEDFGKFLNEPLTDPSSVNVSGIQNSTSEKEDFLRLVRSKRFHVVYGSFGSNPHGPGNYILFKFDQGVVRMIAVTQPERRHNVGGMNIKSNSVSFSGDSLDWFFKATDHTYTRQVNPISDLPPARVYNLAAAKTGTTEIVYNYFLVAY